MMKIDTVEEEMQYLNKVWGKIDLFEKAILITIAFLYFYVLIVILASYDKLTKSSEPEVGKGIFWLTIITSIVMLLPVILHYLSISSFGIIHIIGLIGVLTFVLTLWLIFEFFDKRELDTDSYKDPYSMALYFLLISFSVIYVFGNISRKL
jgi:hypothetical protein